MSVNDQDLHSDCRLFGNERQQETLASAAPCTPWRRSRHRHIIPDDTFETAFDTILTQLRFSIRWQG